MVRVVPKLERAANIAEGVAVDRVKAVVRGLNAQVEALKGLEKGNNIKVVLDNFARATFTGSQSKNLVSETQARMDIHVNVQLDSTDLLHHLSGKAKTSTKLKLADIATESVTTK